MAGMGIDFAAEVQRELAAFEAPAMVPSVRGRRKCSGPSLVFSGRLDIGEIDAIERRAAALSAAVDRLESTVAEVRSLVP